MVLTGRRGAKGDTVGRGSMVSPGSLSDASPERKHEGTEESTGKREISHRGNEP